MKETPKALALAAIEKAEAIASKMTGLDAQLVALCLTECHARVTELQEVKRPRSPKPRAPKPKTAGAS